MILRRIIHVQEICHDLELIVRNVVLFHLPGDNGATVAIVLGSEESGTDSTAK